MSDSTGGSTVEVSGRLTLARKAGVSDRGGGHPTEPIIPQSTGRTAARASCVSSPSAHLLENRLSSLRVIAQFVSHVRRTHHCRAVTISHVASAGDSCFVRVRMHSGGYFAYHLDLCVVSRPFTHTFIYPTSFFIFRF